MRAKMKIMMASLMLMFSLTSRGENQSVSSPNGKYTFEFIQEGGRMYYKVDYDGKDAILRSEMGIEIDNTLFESALGIPRDTTKYWCENLVLRSAETTETDESWTPIYGENSKIRDHYNQLTLHFGKGAKENSQDGYDFDKRQCYMMDIEVRAYNEGVAFRYHFPETSNGLFLNIRGERTQFSFPAGTKALYEEWAQGQYEWRELMNWPNECERPLFLKLANGLNAALLEARMIDYSRGKFKLVSDNVIGVSMFDGAEVISPYSTPWRVIMIGERAVDIINNKDIVLNLNDPCKIADTRFIRPGKVYRCGKLNRDYIMKGISFAEHEKMQFIELDARWYGPEMQVSSSALAVSPERDFTISEVCDSARNHGLGVWVYVNQRALYRQIDSILPLYKEWGVSGIKFGFVQVGNQMWSEWLHDAVRKCADYGIMVDIHDEYRPTGVSRTYPNLLTQEGIGGNEEMPDAWHNLVLPFTRFICGPADYTLSYYCNRIQNTRGHQLAMAAVYYSPLQFMFWYDDPWLYDGGEELEFWRNIPTVFDKSVALEGEPGEYIVQARQSGDVWFVGVMNGLESRTISIDTSKFLKKGKKYLMMTYSDDPSLATRSKVATQTTAIKGGKNIKLDLLASGGAALTFKISE